MATIGMRSRYDASMGRFKKPRKMFTVTALAVESSASSDTFRLARAHRAGRGVMRCLWLVLCAVIPPSTATAVYRNGEDSYPFYRIPSLLYVNASLLLAFAEGRGQRTDHGRVDIVLKRSHDGGVTWSGLSVVHSAGGSRGTIGNPAPLYDAPDVVLFFCVENKEVFMMRSADGGLTWSTPEPLSGWSRPREWAWVASGPPGALVTNGGRWLLPCDGLIGSAQIYKAERVFSFVLVSDDRGASWTQGPLLDGGNECQAAELSNGSIALNMRSRDAVRLHALSDDYGDSWSEPWRARPPVSDGNAEGSMISLADGRLLLATNVDRGRRMLTSRTSTDGGVSWSQHAIIEPGVAAYSSLANLGGGTVGCLYEAACTLDRPGERSGRPVAATGLDCLRYVTLDVATLEAGLGVQRGTGSDSGSEARTTDELRKSEL